MPTMSGGVESASAISDAGGGAPKIERESGPGGREGWVVVLIGAGHYLSHFYALALPPLFPILKTEFGVSYIELGLAMTAYSLLGGIVQAPVGFLVDRLGPRRVLFVGLGMNAVAIGLMGFADVYGVLLVLAVVAGLGNSVFHPADYAILSGSIRPERLGRAFSIHTFSGFLGGACAPIGMLTLAYLIDWRTAMIAAGLVGLVVLAAMILRRDVFLDEQVPEAEAEGTVASGTALSGVRLLMSPPVLMFLAFFIAYGMASGGLTAFTVSALVNLQGLGLDQANGALTGYLFGVVSGILLGGVIVDKFPRHLLTANGSLVLAAAAVITPVLIAPPGIGLIIIMTLTGVGMGAVLPPRDLMIKAITPPGESGKVFGFIFVGYSIGGGIAPLLFGWLLDRGMPGSIFILTAGFVAVSILAVTAAQYLVRR